MQCEARSIDHVRIRGTEVDIYTPLSRGLLSLLTSSHLQATQQLTAVEANKSPLVRIRADRIGVLVHLGKAQRLALLGESPRHAGPRCVDMEEHRGVLLY